MKPYRYSTRAPARPEFNTGKSITRVSVPEQLVGQIQGKKASDLEERVAKSLSRFEVPYSFRESLSPVMASGRRLSSALALMPGALEIDFLALSGVIYPIMVDGFIAHFRTPAERVADEDKTALINEFGKAMGWHELVRLPFTLLTSQGQTDKTVRNALGL